MGSLHHLRQESVCLSQERVMDWPYLTTAVAAPNCTQISPRHPRCSIVLAVEVVVPQVPVVIGPVPVLTGLVATRFIVVVSVGVIGSGEVLLLLLLVAGDTLHIPLVSVRTGAVALRGRTIRATTAAPHTYSSRPSVVPLFLKVIQGRLPIHAIVPLGLTHGDTGGRPALVLREGVRSGKGSNSADCLEAERGRDGEVTRDICFPWGQKVGREENYWVRRGYGRVGRCRSKGDFTSTFDN